MLMVGTKLHRRSSTLEEVTATAAREAVLATFYHLRLLPLLWQPIRMHLLLKELHLLPSPLGAR
jgi:hypothetical protein